MEPAGNGRLFVFVSRTLVTFLFFVACNAGRTLPTDSESTIYADETTNSDSVTTTTALTSTTSDFTTSTSTTSDFTTSTITTSSTTSDTSTSIDGEMLCKFPIPEANCIEWDDKKPQIGVTTLFNITVQPNSIETFLLNPLECGSSLVSKVEGIVLGLELSNSKFCTADFTIACPQNIPFSLYAHEQCTDCDIGNYSLEFRHSGPSNICKTNIDEKNLVYFGNEMVCEYLEDCDLSSVSI